ncbi:heavy metal translocating P-type ATPase [Runella slithyformis]|uniref:P-type Zn(2+) transporter n=1 Tax=Runella slithyformis (strain ATCC 29530 / DSM 19594 / LMG 11500 / NCIMB 11436 / LSU 4) TaxID=761193 RepID=A0A7U3ZIX2_RUNSL|nr:heavy metal translocating P-type ATPase [Runella slithyformis]AEI48066.1 heavy metal translocating P-type ATPase [Runella slithyformis DSM 19594]
MKNSENVPIQPAESANPPQAHTHDHEHSHAHSKEESLLKSRWRLWLSLTILLGFVLAVYVFTLPVTKPVEIGSMTVAYLLAGFPTLERAFRSVRRGDFFNEFTLMSIATLGAFYIGEYSEGVAVMIFYEIGELFQDLAVNRSKRSIKALLDIRPDSVTVLRNGIQVISHPSKVEIGETIVVKPGEKIALDGTLRTEKASFNTSALTGESRPDTKHTGDAVLAGMINLDKVIEMTVSTPFKESKLSRILSMVQDATARKAPTQLFISRFAKIYTPIVFFLALSVILLPFFFVESYQFNEWLYRGMVFLVIACPCALTVSIPLGYFGGIGLASRHGILVKGANFLDVMTELTTVVSDKTGTLTKGVFKVQEVKTSLPESEFIQLTAALENSSTHPIAKAIVEYADAPTDTIKKPTVEQAEEIAGKGLKGIIDGKIILCGNLKLLRQFHIAYPVELDNSVDTLVAVAISNQYVGHLTIADEIKEDAAKAVADLKKLGIETIMLSGDKAEVVQKVADRLQISKAYGELLPEDKVRKVQELKNAGKRIAFAGDGVNDAPVVALADAGIAMGGLGSDATIETADIVIQNDQPSRIVTAIKIGRLTKQVVWQNIILAMSVKIAVMALGAGGVANLWEAVFADVGVALLAILNAYRIQSKTVS